MRHSIDLSDESYEVLVRLAHERGQTPQALIESWVAEQANPAPPRDPRTDPRYYTTDEWFRHLGASEERIQRAKEQAASDTGAGDADA